MHILPTTSAVPPCLASTLERSFAAERGASGGRRRAAFRTTRHLLGAAFASGSTPADVAELTGLGASSLRDRAGNTDGLIALQEFAELAQITERRISGWASAGLLPSMSTDRGGTIGYPARALVLALLATGDEETGSVTKKDPNDSSVSL